MRRIPLTQGKFSEVDEVDYERVAEFRWHAFKVHNTWYAASGGPNKGQRTYLHRFIMDAPVGKEVDHINGDGLDNRKENLRICRHRDNLRNVQRTTISRSGYRGVTIAASGKFVASCKYLGKRLHFGTYDTSEEAARVRDRNVIDLHGEFAVLNFPRHEYENEATG
jgi:hypothetical protein